jgi:hypothetical protein
MSEAVVFSSTSRTPNPTHKAILANKFIARLNQDTDARFPIGTAIPYARSSRWPGSNFHCWDI